MYSIKEFKNTLAYTDGKGEVNRRRRILGRNMIARGPYQRYFFRTTIAHSKLFILQNNVITCYCRYQTNFP